MRHMSFMLTTEQMRTCMKIVTRRVGWTFLKPGDRVLAVEKGMGLKKGEKIKPIGVINILDVRLELLNEMLINPKYGREECVFEGFGHLSPREFVEMFCKSHNHCKIHTVVTRIKFAHEYAPEHKLGCDCWCQPIEKEPGVWVHNDKH